MSGPKRVSIQIEIESDFSIIKSDVGYGGKTTYKICHYIFAHSMMAHATCEADGSHKYSPNYTAIRVEDGHVQYMHPDRGWLIDEEATKKYFDMKAEEALLKT